jgi:hypothetical protein
VLGGERWSEYDVIQYRSLPGFTAPSSFELQIFRDGRWVISAVYDDRYTALDEARRQDRAGRMVRLKEENRDASTRTIFLSSKIKDSWKLECQRIAERAHRYAMTPPYGIDSASEVASTHVESLRPFRLLAIFSVVAFLGLAAIFALRSLYSGI